MGLTGTRGATVAWGGERYGDPRSQSWRATTPSRGVRRGRRRVGLVAAAVAVLLVGTGAVAGAKYLGVWAAQPRT